MLTVLDLRRFDDITQSGDFLTDLRQAAQDNGGFYLTGHGIDEALIDEVLKISRQFFALPEPEKLAIEMVNSPHFRGYTRAGWEYTRGKRDWREQLDVNTECEPVAIGPHTAAWKRLIGPNQWPLALPELRSLLLAYQAEATRVGTRILEVISAALLQDQNALQDLYTPLPTQLLKIIRYPGRDNAESDQGVGPHKDGGLVTLLLQDKVKGLRMCNEQGRWIEVPPRPGSLVLMAGEVLELLTEGFIRAPIHDALAPPVGVERFTIAFFLGARLDAVIPVLDLPGDLKTAQRGVTADPQNPLYREVGFNQLKSRLRSHPDVARRHHADLLSPDELKSSVFASAY